MRLISETQILEVLRRQNHWWGTGKVSEDLAPAVRRLAFLEIQSLFLNPFQRVKPLFLVLKGFGIFKLLNITFLMFMFKIGVYNCPF